MNRFFGWIACLFTLSLQAQDKLVVMGPASARYVIHTTNGKETLQHVSNQFGQSVSKLAAYNHISANTVLAKGTGVKIPLSNDLIVQKRNDNSAPLYHKIGKGDNLYRLSQMYNKVPLSSLKEWNNMKKDLVKSGQLIIIGFMVNAPAEAIVEAESKPEPKKDIIAVNTEKPVISQPLEKARPEKKQLLTPAPQEPVQPEKPKEQKKELTEIKEPAKKELPAVTDYTPKEGDEGYFASAYALHVKDQMQQFRSGDAATFKTISGWTDRKYYVLMNEVAPRTIVRVTGPGNKSICAMVLGPLQETKGAAGLLLRLSNSAASALGIADAKFTITVTYFE